MAVAADAGVGCSAKWCAGRGAGFAAGGADLPARAVSWGEEEEAVDAGGFGAVVTGAAAYVASGFDAMATGFGQAAAAAATGGFLAALVA